MYQLSSHGIANSSGALTPLHLADFHVQAERRGVGGSTGGDFYTVAVRAPGHIGVVIGDTCGHGEEGEANLARILPKVHELALSGASPARLLWELNLIVAADLPGDRFVTAAAFEFDIRTGVLTVANAAHVPALVRRAHDRGVSMVGRPSGIPLGIARTTSYEEERYELNRGDVIVLMTDGVLEAVESDLMTMSTIKRLLSDASEGAGGVHRFLLQQFDDRTRGRCADDMTLMALEAMPVPWASLSNRSNPSSLSNLAQAS